MNDDYDEMDEIYAEYYQSPDFAKDHWNDFKRQAELRKRDVKRTTVLRRAQQMCGRAKIKRVRQYLALRNDYKVNIADLVSLIEHESASTFWAIFSLVWQCCDHNWSDPKVPDAVVDNWCRRLHAAMQRVGQHRSVRRLPATLTVFRGATRSRIGALAWTTDPKVARGFACGGKRNIVLPDPVVAVSRVRRDQVFWCSNKWCKFEVICWPTRWDIIEEISNG
jgi:hypothetical protein